MNFDDAINAHVNWRFKLRQFIEGRGDKLDPAVVGKDNACALGQWIYGEGAKYSSHPEYSVLKDQHGKFHKCAAAVVTKVIGGDKKGAESLIDAGSEFATTSTNVANTISKLRKSVEAK